MDTSIPSATVPSAKTVMGPGPRPPGADERILLALAGDGEVDGGWVGGWLVVGLVVALVVALVVPNTGGALRDLRMFHSTHVTVYHRIPPAVCISTAPITILKHQQS